MGDKHKQETATVLPSPPPELQPTPAFLQAANVEAGVVDAPKSVAENDTKGTNDAGKAQETHNYAVKAPDTRALVEGYTYLHLNQATFPSTWSPGIQAVLMVLEEILAQAYLVEQDLPQVPEMVLSRMLHRSNPDSQLRMLRAADACMAGELRRLQQASPGELLQFLRQKLTREQIVDIFRPLPEPPSTPTES